MPKIKICPKCGAQMDRSAKACPQCGAPAKSKKGWIIAGIIAAIIIIPAAAGGSNKETTSDTPTVVSQAEANEESKSLVSSETVTSEVSSSETFSSEATEETKSNIFHLGDSIDTGKAIVTFKSAEDYTTDNMFMQPQEGNKLICAYFIIENTGNSDLFTGPFDFSCYADNSSTEAHYFDEKALSSDTLSPGRKSEGYVWFEVPENAVKIEIEYEMSWWTQDKAIFIVKE